jgi:protein TonB
MLAIIAGHVALVAAVMSVKMDLPSRIMDRPIKVFRVEPVDPPPPAPPVDQAQTRPSHLTTTGPVAPTPPLPNSIFPINPTLPDPGPVVGPEIVPNPPPVPIPSPAPVRLGPQLRTPPSELRPPYPPAKLVAGEEAVLRLRLSIDERGRVVVVEPLGRADRAFVDAARRHLIAHWRYKPASEDGRAVAASTVITLRFELDG